MELETSDESVRVSSGSPIANRAHVKKGGRAWMDGRVKPRDYSEYWIGVPRTRVPDAVVCFCRDFDMIARLSAQASGVGLRRRLINDDDLISEHSCHLQTDLVYNLNVL